MGLYHNALDHIPHAGKMVGEDEMINETQTFWERLGTKLTSRKLWGMLVATALTIFIGYAGGWGLAVDFGKIIIPVVFAVFMGSIAAEKRSSK